jgi:aryl-alcohol dehydrogenase-like predicted oxidoreductase
MTALMRMGLGTVQFGTSYGVSNTQGRPDEAEIAAILERAVEMRVGYLDTAPSYGNSETLIGRHLPSRHGLRIIVKTPPIAEPAIEARHGAALLDALASSLDRLKMDRVYGVLVHHAPDLGKPGWQYLFDALHEAKARGLVTRIGASVYDDAEIALVESRFRPELVQAAFNVLDRRMEETGSIARLKALGAEIHARSVFLQGLLLMQPSVMPPFFSSISGVVEDLHRQWAAVGLSPLAGCLAFVLGRCDVDVVVVGVNRRSEFEELAEAFAKSADVKINCGLLKRLDPDVLDPRRWPRVAG